MTSKQKETLLESIGFFKTVHGNYSKKINNSFLGKLEIVISNNSKILVFGRNKESAILDDILIIYKRFTKLNTIEIINFLEQ